MRRYVPLRRALGASSAGIALLSACVDIAGVDPWDDAATSGDAGPDAGTLDASGAYWDLVMKHEPIAYWRLDETTLPNAANETGESAEYVGDVTLGVPGAVPGSTAVAFDGGGFVRTPLDDEVEFLDKVPFSIELWTQPIWWDTGYRHVLGKETNIGPGRNGYALVAHGTDAGLQVYFEIYYEDTMSLCEARAILDADRMTHVVVTFNGEELRLYLDAKLEVDDCSGLALPGNDFQFHIAANSASTGTRYSGVIDEVAIYPVVLSGEEIQAHFEAGQPR